jgi:hypothetical protein
MTNNVVISEVDAFMYVVLSKAEKHVPYGILVDTTKCLTLYEYIRCRKRQGRLKRVQLYL